MGVPCQLPIGAIVFLGIFITETLLLARPNPWNSDHLPEIQLTKLSDKSYCRKWQRKKVWLRAKYQGLQGEWLYLWKSPLSFRLRLRNNPYRREIIQVVESLKIYDNLKVFGELQYFLENDLFMFYVYFLERDRNDFVLFRDKFEEGIEKKASLEFFEQLYREIEKILPLHTKKVREGRKVKSFLTEEGQKLAKLKKKIVKYLFQRREEEADPTDFQANFRLSLKYLELKQYEKAREKMIHCYSLKPDHPQVVYYLEKVFHLVPYREGKKIIWTSLESYYRKQNYVLYKGRFFPPTWKLFLEKILRFKGKQNAFYILSAQAQIQFAEKAAREKKIDLYYNRYAVVMGWGYPDQILRHTFSDVRKTFEMWLYQDGRWVLFEQTSKEKFARVIDYRR